MDSTVATPVVAPSQSLPTNALPATTAEPKSAWDIVMKYITFIMNFLVFGFLLYIFVMLISIRKVVGKIWKNKERYIPSHEHYKTPVLGENEEEGYATDSDDEDSPKTKKKKKSDEEGYKAESDDEDTPKPKKKKASDEEGYKAESDDEDTPKPKKKKASDEEGYKAESDDEDTPKPKKKKAPDEEGYKADADDEDTPKPKKKTPAPEDFIPVYTNNTIVSEGYYTGARENFVQQQPRRLFNIFA